MMNMSRLICLWAFGSVFCFQGAVSAELLFERGLEWKFFKGAREPSIAESRWWETEFDDSDWLRGPAPFRYGDGQGGTVLNDMPRRYSTVYLRRTFRVSNTENISGLDLLVDFDDGFKVWINDRIVLSVNAPGEPRFNSFASDSHESGQFEAFQIDDPASVLKAGINSIAIQGFNINPTSSDFVINAELESIEPDPVPPRVVSISPEPGNVLALDKVTVRFSEPVVGLDIDDLRLNGLEAEDLTGQEDTWTFSFKPLDSGEATLSWAPNHGIQDRARPPNPFDTGGSGEALTYRIVDDIPPALVEIIPPPGSTVSRLSRVRLFFSEPVMGFDTGDISINGIHPTTVNGLADGPWQLDFEPMTEGTLNVVWSAGHGVTDKAAQPNGFDEPNWSYTVDAGHQPAGVVINEFVASNQNGLADEDGLRHDWIELKNLGRETVQLAGWSLTDDPDRPGRWVFPSVSIAPENYLVVFASGLNRRDPGGAFHTNFRLGAGGDYLGLFDPELPRRVVDQVLPSYPPQRNDTSYGRMTNGEYAYFPEPTPKGENGKRGFETALAKPKFSVKRGFYNEPFSVELTCVDPAATIRYTLDSSMPTVTSGKLYRKPVEIRRTTVLRAAAFAAEAIASEVATQTLILDRSDAMISLPVLSLVTPEDNLWGRTGIMEVNPRNTNKRGIEWERPVSAELLFHESPDDGFQYECGLRIQGGDHIRDHYRRRSKYSFRLYFRGAYGPSQLEYPLFPRLPVTEFERVVLRAGMNDSHNPFIADELVRRLHHDMGQPASQGVILNLFLNGKYKGYYNATERIDNAFLRSRHGGGSDWDLIAQFGQVREGDMIEWDRLRQTVNGSDLSRSENYAEASRQMDIVNFIDYIILNVCVGMDDWPDNNWRAARERVARSKWRFYAWDGERSFGKDIRHFHGADPLSWDNLTRGALTRQSDVARLFRSLLASPEFRLEFADRVQKHFFNGGALTDVNITRRHSELVRVMRAVLPDMNPFIERVWIPNRRAIVMKQFATMGLLRSENAPRFSRHGGSVPGGYRLSINSPKGSVYCTLDGTDPCRFGSEPNPASAYSKPLTINTPVSVKARTWADGRWSGLTEATFLPEPVGHPVRIAEVMYNPPGGSAYEFVELLNTGGASADLGWYRFRGIDFTFGMTDSVAPGERIVLASNADPVAFLRRYPRLQVDGWFAGRLADGGESLSLENRDGITVAKVSYGDDGNWPQLADGNGASLEIIDPLASADSASNWVASAEPGGTPGKQGRTRR